MKVLLVALFLVAAVCAKKEKEPEQKLQWKDEDGLEVKIIRPIKAEKCKQKSQPGDIIAQWYKLTDKDGNELGSNFNKAPYQFTLGKAQVIPGMDRAMTGMCVLEKRKVVIPPNLGFKALGKGMGGDGLDSDQPLYYTVQLVGLFRPNPGNKWEEADGLAIEVTHKIEDAECKRAEAGDKIYQHYTLRLEPGGKIIDSSNDKPFVFRLGKGEVITGMDRAMDGMCEGEERKVVIPSDLGYGDEGSPPDVPGKATLYFDITLEKLEKAEKKKDEL